MSRMVVAHCGSERVQAVGEPPPAGWQNPQDGPGWGGQGARLPGPSAPGNRVIHSQTPQGPGRGANEWSRMRGRKTTAPAPAP